MSKSSASKPQEWINTQGEAFVMVTKAEYEDLKAQVAELERQLEVKPLTIERLRAAVERLRRERSDAG